MKSLHALILSATILHLIKTCTAQYLWNCSMPDDDGKRYIPGIEIGLENNIVIAPTAGDAVNLYRVQNLNSDCTGGVTAIEFCYRYNSTAGQEEPVFNWTVLILEETNRFTITRIITIESHPILLNEGHCMDVGGGWIGCCDREDFNTFSVVTNNMFIFGVTESAQGNTHGAMLLRAHESQPEYKVDTLRISTEGQTIAVGSTLPRPTGQQLGLQLLQFVIAPSSRPTDSTSSPTDLGTIATTPRDLASTGDQATDPTTLTVTTANAPSTMSTTDNTEIHDTTSSSNQEPDSTYHDQNSETSIPITPTASTDASATQGVLGLLPYIVGGAVGGIVLIIVIVLTVVIVSLLVRKSRKKSHKVETSKNIGLLAYNNALYDVAGGDSNGNFKHATTNLCLPASEEGKFSTAVYANITEKNEVETLPAQDYTLPISSNNYSMRPEETHYEETSEQVYATTYEVPGTLGSNNAARYDSVDDENPYMLPATNEHALYRQLSQIRISHFARDSIKMTKLLGAGQFGQVHQGRWKATTSENEVEIAVKTLQEGADEEDKVKFLQEAAIMGQFSHPNVVKLYGVVTEGEPIMLIIELLPKGDLRELLCSMRSQSNYEYGIDADLPHTLLSYCRQVASGMSYLAGKCFVHRDLAARNVLVSEDDVCKIADFGMSRDLEDANYYISQGGKIPVKWTAPEALHYKKYSTASDVWSFGCVMFEIWSLGYKPFEDITNLKCVELIKKGTRLAPPPGCPRNIYKLMMDCWHPEYSSRPDFVSVVQQLSPSDTKLLKWSEEDKATDPEAATLGAELDKAVDLYKDLQHIYILQPIN